MNFKRVTFSPYRVIFILTLLVAVWLIQFSGTLAAPPGQETVGIAAITQPGNGATVQGVVPIIGSSDHPAFQFYTVEFSPTDPGNQWQFIGDGQTPVVNGQLTSWDTMTVPDGSYTIRLRTVRVDGNYDEAFVEIVVANAQPLPTNTPAVAEETPTPGFAVPTETPTPLPPTPTILIEQPIVETPTPRPVETTAPLADPDESQTFIPTVSGFSLSPLRDACLYGGGLMLALFLLFGFLSALRLFVQGFIDRARQRRER